YAWLRAFAEPFRGQQLVATGSAISKHELADARQVARRHAQPRGRNRLAVAWPVACGNPSLLVVDPLGRPEPERIEQCSARIIRQGLARALGDDAPEKSRGASAIEPAFSRWADDRPLEDEAIAVLRHLHADFIVLGVAVRDQNLIPLQA